MFMLQDHHDGIAKCVRILRKSHDSENTGLAKDKRNRRFRALFGVFPTICALTWNLMEHKVPEQGRPIHLLWALLFLKVYATERVNSVIACVDEKTFRKWSWLFVSLISELNQIRWDSRLLGRFYHRCRVSVDGTDFRIYEPTPFDPKWYSHKFKGPGVRYEVGVCIDTGSIVWTHGPFPCGSHPDLTIFRLALKHALESNEKVVADGGYNDECCVNPGDIESNQRFNTIERARHETVNRRFKQFFVLSHRFRHRTHLHSRCFHAVTNIVQIQLDNGEPLFDVADIE